MEEKFVRKSDTSIVKSIVLSPTSIDESSTGKPALALVARDEMEMAVVPFVGERAVVVLIRTEELGHRLFDGGDSMDEFAKLRRLRVSEDINGAIPLEGEIASSEIVLA